MLHTRLRPHCKDFLEKIAKLYELHVFTFGSRLYAHTIAGKSSTVWGPKTNSGRRLFLVFKGILFKTRNGAETHG